MQNTLFRSTEPGDRVQKLTAILRKRLEHLITEPQLETLIGAIGWEWQHTLRVYHNSAGFTRALSRRQPDDTTNVVFGNVDLFAGKKGNDRTGILHAPDEASAVIIVRHNRKRQYGFVHIYVPAEHQEVAI